LSRLVLHVVYYTDPLCPWSWAAEPELRRLEVEFSDQVAFTYVMVGMARETDPAQLLAETLDAAAQSGMPADARIWLEGAPRSSHPACLAVKAASEQGRDGPYLRRLREGLMTRRERIDNPDAFLAAARDVGGLDVARLDVDMRSNAMVELFGADRDRAVAACGDDRPSLPSFALDDGPPLGPDRLREALLAAGAEPGPLPGPEAALRRFGAMAPAEVAAVCGLPAVRASMELWRLAGEFRVRLRPGAFGELWEPAA
jgi:predicted DsbA family dithiol-disulfide isomerase